eukprot:819291-Rhodomonas_salina.2
MLSTSRLAVPLPRVLRHGPRAMRPHVLRPFALKRHFLRPFRVLLLLLVDLQPFDRHHLVLRGGWRRGRGREEGSGVGEPGGVQQARRKERRRSLLPSALLFLRSLLFR